MKTGDWPQVIRGGRFSPGSVPPVPGGRGLRPAGCALAGCSLLLSLLLGAPVWAGEWSIVWGVGAAFFRPTVYDGTWRQDGVQPTNFKLADHAWTIGIEYRINQKWSIEGHRFDWGSSGAKSRFVSDDDYDPIHHQCLRNCDTAPYFKVVDKMWGYDLTVTRHFPMDAHWEVNLKAGGALAFHRLRWSDGNGHATPTVLDGTIPMVVVGGGLCFDRLCWDNSFYMGTLSMNGGCLGGGQYDCGYPIAKQVGTSMLLFKIPIGGS